MKQVHYSCRSGQNQRMGQQMGRWRGQMRRWRHGINLCLSKPMKYKHQWHEIPDIKLQKRWAILYWGWNWWNSYRVQIKRANQVMLTDKSYTMQKIQHYLECCHNHDKSLMYSLFWWRSRRIKRERLPIFSGMLLSKFFAVEVRCTVNPIPYYELLRVNLVVE